MWHGSICTQEFHLFFLYNPPFFLYNPKFLIHKYNNYCSDITITFPSNGKFTEKQKLIYNAVLEANRAVYHAAKPGVEWDAMHLLAERVILKHLISMGIVKNAPMEELVEKRIGAIFFPHGLGHLLVISIFLWRFYWEF